MGRDVRGDAAFPGHLGISAYDLPTRDKVPLIQELMAADGEGLALDIGSGTGYATYCVFVNQPTFCVDSHVSNLFYHRKRVASDAKARQPFCVVAEATVLPFKAGKFHFVLCSEVLEHLKDDDTAVSEMARVLANNGRAVITVPYTGLGFTSFLELCRIKTVHDFPGPERHVRSGYDECSIEKLLSRHGLEIERHTFYLRFFSRLVTDLISLVHMLYQRAIHHRRAWNWSEVAAAENGLAFRLYTWIFPVLWGFSRLDKLLGWTRGFGLVVAVSKRVG